MIGWWWLLAAFFAGGFIGILSMALMAINRDTER